MNEELIFENVHEQLETLGKKHGPAKMKTALAINIVANAINFLEDDETSNKAMRCFEELLVDSETLTPEVIHILEKLKRLQEVSWEAHQQEFDVMEILR